MAQYDLILTQNTHATLTEFSEKLVNIAKGGLLSAATGGLPTVLAGGTNGYQLVRDDAEVTGLKWVAIAGGHTQGTDAGTTAAIFGIDTDGFDVELTAESASKLGLKVSGGATYADVQAKDCTFNKVTVGSAAPTGAYELCHKTYVDGLLAANDAMQFKGTVGTGGTYTITNFNALSSYEAGWSFKAIEAGTIKGKVCEIGDLCIATLDRGGTGNLDGDWVVVQTNIDGAVTGPASTTDNYVALFSGATGKILKAGTGALGTAAYVATGTFATATQGAAADNAIPKSTFTATGNELLLGSAASTYSALAIPASSFVGRKASGNVAGITVAEAMALLWQAVPATKTAAGTAGWLAKDTNYLYVCDATNVWSRMPKSTNW
jgi:hypothetical protein